MNTNEDESSSLAREAVGLIAETSRPVTEGRVLAPFAHRLLQRVSDQFAGLAGEEGALTWVRKNPDDPAALIALHDRLARHLRDDPRFAADLADLVRGHKSSGGVSVSAEKIEKVAIVQGNGHIENFTM